MNYSDKYHFFNLYHLKKKRKIIQIYYKSNIKFKNHEKNEYNK